MTGCDRYVNQLGEFSPMALSKSQDVKARLCNKLRPEGYWEGKIFVYGPVVAMSVSLALVVVGIWIDVFSFEFEGLGGWALGPDNRIRSFSVVSLGFAVPAASADPDGFPVHWLMVVYLVFAAFAVVAYFVFLLVLWCAPLSPKLQTHFFVLCQIGSAWSCVDVFVV